MHHWLKQLGQDPERLRALFRHVLSHFHRDQCLVYAGMLTYATLLSLVPLTTVVVSMIAALPGTADWSANIQSFLFNNFVPAAQETIQGKLDELANRGRELTATMGIFLLFTSLLLMHTIEETLNRIFGVKTPRSWPGRFAVYWATLTLGPILLGASLALSSFFYVRFVQNVGESSLLLALAQAVTPFAVAALAFFLTFVIVPNRRVPMRQALVGALVTAFMFELAKKGFGLYVARADSYSELYGVLAAIPIFLFWIYLTWSIILLGASFTASLNTFDYTRLEDEWPEDEQFVLLYRVLGHLWKVQQKGGGLDEVQLMALEPDAADHQIQQMLENLRRAGIVRRDESGQWVLVRDLTALSLGELYNTGVYTWPHPDCAVLRDRASPWNKRLADALAELEPQRSQVLARSLSSLYSSRDNVLPIDKGERQA